MRRRLALLALIVAAACSSYGAETDEENPPADAGSGDASDASAPTDDVTVAEEAATDGGTCVMTDPFTSVEPIGLGGTNVQVSDPRFALDERYVVFKRHVIDAGPASADATAGAVAELTSASRSSSTAAFGGPNALGSLATAIDVNGPTLTPNLLTIVYARYNGTGSAWDLVAATRATPSADFSPSSITGVNAGSNTSDFYPYLSHDGSRLYFTSNRSTANSIFTVAFGSGDAPENVPRDGASASDLAPVVSGDGRTLYFARTAPGELTNIAASSAIYVSHRSSSAVAFEPPVLVDEVNVIAARNLPSWISPDGCHLYLTSSRGGKLDVYVAKRAPK